MSSVTHSTEVLTKIKFDVDVTVPMMGQGACGCLVTRKVTKHPVILTNEGRFVVADRGSNAEEHLKTVALVADMIRARVDSDEQKFQIVCKACKFDPENSKAVTVKTVQKLKAIFED